MKISDHELRTNRLVFYSQDVNRLDAELDSFLELSGARSALLIDREGHSVTRRGEAPVESEETLAALVAGSFAATSQMAALLGEQEFSSLFHQGARQSIQLSLVGGRTLLAILWDERTNLGLVRFYAQETGRRLANVFQEIECRPVPVDENLSDNYSAEATAALDDLF
ncbi:MAG: putative regulator of Ras-like GTPase activity (Roadblock/LC7/MglB family) [Planctomycetota bacterium]|jgi:predicted regulator of Ras-like GTPase activity (Roadblock/LC7/MglB family)